MAQHIVCLTFDFDVMSGHIARKMTTPTPISRGEFGIVGARRILSLLRARNIPSTWFVPGFTIETYPDACAQVVDGGHEIGHHGWTHVQPALLEPAQEKSEMIRANDVIERLTGQKARGYRSPAWDLSPHTVEFLLEQGFYYESSMMGHDYSPYRVRQGDVIELQKPMVFGPETPLIEIPVSWSQDDHPHFEMTAARDGHRNTNSVMENWVDDFIYMTRITDWGIATYTCHPYVIGRGHRMLMLERFIDKLTDLGAVFMTMEDAARLYDQREPFKG
ncbi:MAG: polysaccharide deacetylase [Rhodospirillaceae bacterium]|jgi:peptidoglycan-N-acetylglucosamine deacetylase|nr:polysaccharide deacetylase [Rhodospirillaceae bacterium]MBT4688000.1 polysaccharide deacetylase [Rhodospirillaceae bacterium]MBT5083486.1 polysaccharide deacetylase [Rhodospirillaceae bacterium]MBT5527243.1 polysaccharide deacetylase [Rhodospirillaceae bacterium]MBT5879968.1 polysaccharide deacetylase [Rhodospirillaceae bacterium]